MCVCVCVCVRERKREWEQVRGRGHTTFSTGLAVVCCATAITVLGPSLSPSLNRDLWNATDLSPCLFLSSSSRINSSMPAPASQAQTSCSNILPRSTINTSSYKSKHKKIMYYMLPSLVGQTHYVHVVSLTAYLYS